jgi:hypothetical protein
MVAFTFPLIELTRFAIAVAVEMPEQSTLQVGPQDV